jgi:hypothetical protein
MGLCTLTMPDGMSDASQDVGDANAEDYRQGNHQEFEFRQVT